MIGIYKITNTKNGKVYIGQSVDVEKRLKSHTSLLDLGEHANYRLQDDWNIYGRDAFEFETVIKCRSNDLNINERTLIKAYNSTDKEYGYNLSPGIGKNLQKYKVGYITARANGVNFKKLREYSATPRDENAFFRNEKGKITYNSMCIDCEMGCKQSFRAEVLACKKR